MYDLNYLDKLLNMVKLFEVKNTTHFMGSFRIFVMKAYTL